MDSSFPLILAFLASVATASDEFYDFANIRVEDSFDGLSFKPRAEIAFRPAIDNSAYLTQKQAFTNTENELFNKLDRNDDYYHVRLAVESPNGTTYRESSIRACLIRSAGTKLSIDLSLNMMSEVMGVHLGTTKTSCKLLSKNAPDFDLNHVDFQATSQKQVFGALPNTQPFLRKLEAQNREREQEQKRDDRSFLAKYWMYIVPAVLFLMLSAG